MGSHHMIYTAQFLESLLESEKEVIIEWSVEARNCTNCRIQVLVLD